MAKDRLDRFQKALEMLAHVLKELTEAKQPAGPAGAAAANTTQKAGAAPGVESLVASIDELTTVVKRQHDELAGQRRARASPEPAQGPCGRGPPRCRPHPGDRHRDSGQSRNRGEDRSHAPADGARAARWAAGYIDREFVQQWRLALAVAPVAIALVWLACQ
jgi:hypothetical protein